MKHISMIVAVCLWAVFLYVASVAIVVHLLPHVLSWKLDYKLVLFLLIDAAILQLLAWIYKKLPAKPKNIVFSWVEKVSFF